MAGLTFLTTVVSLVMTPAETLIMPSLWPTVSLESCSCWMLRTCWCRGLMRSPSWPTCHSTTTISPRWNRKWPSRRDWPRWGYTTGGTTPNSPSSQKTWLYLLLVWIPIVNQYSSLCVCMDRWWAYLWSWIVWKSSMRGWSQICSTGSEPR